MVLGSFATSLKTPTPRTLLYSSLLLFTLIGCGGGDDNESNSTNLLPTPNAGADQSVEETANVTLNGTAIDSDGTISRYVWSQESGTQVQISDVNQPVITFEAPDISVDETLVFRLTVTDNDGGSSSDEVSVAVIANLAPIVEAGEDTIVDERSQVTLTGQANDTDGSISEYQWTQLSGPTIEIPDATGSALSFLAPDVEDTQVVTLQLSAIDDDGNSGSDTVSVTINPTFYSITLSSKTDQCGEAISEEVIITFTADDGSQNSYPIEHDGTEQTYTFENEAATGESKTLNVVTSGKSYYVSDVNSSVPLYFELATNEQSDTCSCPEYDFTLINAPIPNTTSTTSGLFIGDTWQPRTSDNYWEAITICDVDEDLVYIIDSENSLYRKIDLDTRQQYVIDGLDDMALTVLDGERLPVFGGISGVYVNAYTPNNDNGLTPIFRYADLDASDGLANFILDENNTDSRIEARIDADYMNITINESFGFIEESYESLIFQQEWHVWEDTTSEIASGFEYEVFNLDSINITINSDQLSLSGSNTAQFDYARVILPFTTQPGGSVDITLPAENGVFNFSSIDRAVDNPFSGSPYYFVLLVDQSGNESYDDAIQRQFTKRIPSRSYSSRALFFLVVP